ncbi:type II toxin-antitoxin system prevent-host-death family antitoxin [Candidatus Poribacteria bacterium]|nr:type II toxin-antitoxin system prevent-host-death family antitoxin [Candidatus Poribacteria bacterium]
MAKIVSIMEAKEHLEELIGEMKNDTEEIIISQCGTPVAQLTPIPQQPQQKPWPSPEEIAQLLEGADTLEEIKARLKKAGLHHPLIEVAGIFKDDPTWDDYMRTLRRIRKGK